MIIDETHPPSGTLYETSSKAYELCLPTYNSPPCIIIDTTVLGVQMDLFAFSILSSILGYRAFSLTWKSMNHLEERHWNIFGF
jgi:hypothetical protein